MPKAPLIRADTIDLQDQHSPSAQDHSRQPATPGALGEGPPAPHQAASLRHASTDDATLVSKSPRASQDLSGKELQLLHEIHSDIDEQDAAEIEASLGISRNGDQAGQPANGHDGEEDDEDDEGLDDDMMDKISSSPSIDDGWYSEPQRSGSDESSAAFPDAVSSSAFTPFSPFLHLESPEHLPFGFVREGAGEPQHHHQTVPGEYPTTPEPDDCFEDFDDSDGSVDSDDTNESSDSIDSLFDGSSEYRANVDYDLSAYAESDSDGYNFHEALEQAVEDHLRTIAARQNSRSDPPLNSGQPTDSEQTHGYDDDANDPRLEGPRFIDSGYGDECLQDAEDIDFEFVYALHTFVATVEGQANATKGDTMVLLDDSNSYWWLVRVVKDSSIGYLPAEHIETPTERLARLNKHRNIDLSQTMLGDNPEKSRNPLKKAMRRRNVKTVTFTDPTYYEADPEEYSSDEEGDEEPEFITTADAARNGNDQQQAQQAQDAQAQQNQNEAAKVEPLRIRSVSQRDQQSDQAVNGSGGDDQPKADPRIDRPRASEESMESTDSGAAKSNRRMRNTDSFYKDESIETRKISLTPNLLRDDSAGGGTVQDARASLEGSEKQSSFEKPRDEKKKEKKPSKFSGFFKRKNSKTSKPVAAEEEPEDWIRQESQTSSRGSPQPKPSQDSLQADQQQAPTSPQKTQPSRQSSKLQKTQKGGSLRKSSSRDEPSLKSTSGGASGAEQVGARTDGPSAGSEGNPFDDSYDADASRPQGGKARTPESSNNGSRVTSPTSDSLRHVFHPVRDAFRNSPPSSAGELKVEKVKRAKNRMALEDSDSEAEAQDSAVASFPAAPTHTVPQQQGDRLSESPVHVAAPPQSQQAAAPDAAAPNGRMSPTSVSSSPELVERPSDAQSAQASAPQASFSQAATAAPGATARALTPPLAAANEASVAHEPPSVSNTPTTTASTRSRPPEWSDALLRNYMDSCGDEFRDMMAIVYAPSSPAGKVNRDDPLWKRHEATMARCDDLQHKLDRLLLDFYRSRGVEF